MSTTPDPHNGTDLRCPPAAHLTTTTFTISGGAAAKIGFTAQPVSGDRNADFTPQPVVAIQDAGGNTVTKASSATVTLTYTPEAHGIDMTCNTSNVRTTSEGVATFTGCNVKKAGEFQLVAAVPGFSTVTSTPFPLQ